MTSYSILYRPLYSDFGFQTGIRKHLDIKTPTVCHILDVTGEVAAGVASLEAVVSCF